MPTTKNVMTETTKERLPNTDNHWKLSIVVYEYDYDDAGTIVGEQRILHEWSQIFDVEPAIYGQDWT